MRTCCCALAGTKHCDVCSNGPSRLNTGVDPTIKTFNTTSIDLNNSEFDPTKAILEFLEKLDFYEQEKKKESFERIFMPK